MPNLFKSFLMGGFECSTHRNYLRKRVDVIEWTRHDEFAESDYERLLMQGIKVARDGVRWHLIEKEPFVYDFSSLEKQAVAAQKMDVQIIWDFFHYGFPDNLDIFSPVFIERFVAFSLATSEFLQSYSDNPLIVSLTNEISFYAWIAGDVGGFAPFVNGRANELKRQLVKATLTAAKAIRQNFPQTRFVQTDPAIRVAPSNNRKQTIIDAANYHASQFEALDMQTGKIAPEFGGDWSFPDVIGVNYYFNNQWKHPSGKRIFRDNSEYKPFHEILADFYARYQRPLIVAETGIEDEERPAWFRYIWEECQIAIKNGIPLEGLCLYPIVNHPGWDDARHCRNGLWDYPDEQGKREIYQPLADEIARLARKLQSTTAKL